MSDKCFCAAHTELGSYRWTDQHMLRWDPDGTRWIAVKRKGRVLAEMLDGSGPIQMECPDCGELNEVGPQAVEHVH